jgi:hypothetical protein
MSALLSSALLALTSTADAGMELHLREAVALNSDRMERYAALTDGRSDGLVHRLILNERALVPVARAIDAWARPYNERGIPVVQGDFVSMERAAPFGTSMEPTMPMGDVEEAATKALLWDLYRTSGGSLEATVDACAQTLDELTLIESEAGVVFPMSRHLVESLGYSALHGIEHNRASEGETAALVGALVGMQRLGLVTLDPVGIDRQANAFHQQGIGILVNDVPPIPFEEELRTGCCCS